MKRQILAMGGGGFSMEPDNLALDRHLLSLVDTPRPKICFIGTASGDAEGYIDNFYRAFEALECAPSHLSLFKPPAGDLGAFVFDKDIFYVGGGNTRSMLALWREWGLDQRLIEAYEAGKVLAGLSAGAICWFEEGVTDSTPGALSKLDGLGLLPGSCCPHYDGEEARRGAYHRLIAEGMKPGYACDDGVAGHFVDGRLVEFVSSRPEAMAYRVGPEGEVGVRPRDLREP